MVESHSAPGGQDGDSVRPKNPVAYTDDRVQEAVMTPADVVTRIKTEDIQDFEILKSDADTSICSPLASQVRDSQNNYRCIDEATGEHVCLICRKSYKNLMSISTHLRRVHHVSRKPISNFPCLICSKTFVLQSKLNTHMRIHQGQSNCF